MAWYERKILTSKPLTPQMTGDIANNLLENYGVEAVFERKQRARERL